MAIKDVSVSIMQKLKNQSKLMGVSTQTVYQLFAQEEFLRKLVQQVIFPVGYDIWCFFEQ